MKEKILVGLSGGVDSATTAILLKEKGYDVIGATMSIWGDRDIDLKTRTKGTHGACFGPDEKEDIEAAQKIADTIGIPYHVFDCAKEYDEIVLKYFKDEYLKGKTPNPCIRCNALIKFGAFPHVAREFGIEFDKFATGHYARIVEDNGKYFVKRGIDSTKDQSYFLYRLKQEQLKNIILPLGSYTKAEIREIAANHGLDVANKPDSQDFYDGDYNELLGVEEKIGNIVDTDGKILGTHKGIWNYTVGQRKGIGISSSEPLYVLRLDKDNNEVVVGARDKTFKKSLIASDINFIAPIPYGEKLCAKIRSSQIPQDVTVEKLDDDKIKVIFEEYQKSIAPGQSVVIYDKDTLLAGGIIDSAE